MASPFSLPAALNPPLTGRDAVIDALHRCVMAFDTDDTALFDSSFIPDGVLEVNGRPWTGLSEIHATALGLIFSVDTTHLATNLRVNMGAGTVKTEAAEQDETGASLTATVLSQHFAKDKGMDIGQKNLMGGSLYRGDLVKDADGLWKFKLLRIKAAWVSGDWSVLGGNPAEMEA